jgi:hypothetical protein
MFGQHANPVAAAGSLDPSIVATLVASPGCATRHDTPANGRPVVTVLDAAGSEIDQQRLIAPPRRNDG